MARSAEPSQQLADLVLRLNGAWRMPAGLEVTRSPLRPVAVFRRGTIIEQAR